MKAAIPVTDPREFGPMVETCRAYGISRTVAFRLSDQGLLETFRIGRRRYVVLSSLRALPERIAESRRDAA